MYNRGLTKEILNKIESKEVVFLLGTRQAGKATLSMLISEASGFDNAHIFFSILRIRNIGHCSIWRIPG